MAYQNAYGRVGGRGLRPWLLLPKVFAVGVYFGALVATTVIWFVQVNAPSMMRLTPGGGIEQVSFMFRFVIVPALLGTAAMGVMLFIQHPRVFSRLRWWQVKAGMLVLGVPTAHFFVSSRLAALRQAELAHTPNPHAQWQFSAGLLVLIAASMCIIALGRLKPRLGQNWARVYSKMHGHPQGDQTQPTRG